MNIDGATAYGPSPITPGQEPAGIHYVGVKTDNNSYAWIMIDVVPGVELIIMGYAFEDNGGPIDAGDIGIVPPNSVYEVNPGFGGQSFIKNTYEKPSEKKKRILQENIKRVKKLNKLKNRI